MLICLNLLRNSCSQDSKLSGEAATQPSVRMPPLREGRLPKLMGAALACRLTGEGALPSTDAIMMLDGGREGGISSYSPLPLTSQSEFKV